MAPADEFPNLQILDHPLIQHKLSHLRDINTTTQRFRELLREIAMLMGYEVTRDLPTSMHSIETPMATMETPVIAGRKLALVPVMRAGMGMAEGLLDLVPSARIGHIGVYRDPLTKRPVEYLNKLPTAEDRTFIMVDPMLATGHSAAHALELVKRHGVPGDRTRFMALVAAPEGVRVVQEQHPDVKIFVAALDSHLDENAYIIPGLGDAGDRMYGTK